MLYANLYILIGKVRSTLNSHKFKYGLIAKKILILNKHNMKNNNIRNEYFIHEKSTLHVATN